MCENYGGKQVHIECWLESEAIRKYVEARNLTSPYTATDLAHEYELRVISLVERLGKRPIIWQVGQP